MYKSLLFLLCLLLLFCTNFIPISASEQFDTQITIKYVFSSDGSSTVTQEYSLTNLTSQTGASAYEFDIYDKAPENLSAYDSHGKLDLKLVTHSSGLTRVLIPFKQLTAGKGKTYKFYLTYDGPKTTKVDGLWKIMLPNTTSNDPSRETVIQLIVPDSFGTPLSLFPSTSSFIKKDGLLTYTFDSGSSAGSSGIYAIFGNLSLIGFELTYYPENEGDDLEIPKDKPGQLIFIQKIDPRPDNIQVTGDGKWVLQYKKLPERSVISGYLLVEATSSANFPQTGNLSLTNLTQLPEASPGLPVITFHKPFQILPFFSFPARVIVTNPGSQAIYHISLSFHSDNLIIDTKKTESVPVIPPFGSIEIPLDLKTSFLPDISDCHLSVTAGPSAVTYNISATHFVLWYAIISLSIITTIIASGFFTVFTWRLHFQRQAGPGNLHRKSK